MAADNGLSDDVMHEIATSSGETLGAGYQATVSLHRTSGGNFVVKTARQGLLSGRAGTLREYEAYKRLGGVSGIPATFGIVGDSGLILEYIDGASLRRGEAALHDRDSFFAKLLGTIDAMHAAGVAHCDLKRKDNTLVGPDETPYLIDFGVACLADDSDGWLKRRWFRMMRQMDFNAWVKLRFGRNPQDLPQEVAARYQPLMLEKIARWIRIPWQKLTFRRLRQRWRKNQ